MRRIGALAAAASAISLCLTVPAQAAPSPTHLVGTASCIDGGRIRLATSLDADRTAKAVATISGVKEKRWGGEVIAGVDDSAAGDLTSDSAVVSPTGFRAPHGTFTAVATRPDATTADAVAYFLGAGSAVSGRSGSAACVAVVVAKGTMFLVANAWGDEGLAVAAGARSAVDAHIMGLKGDRYRATFIVAGKGGRQRRVVQKTAKKIGELDLVARDFKHLSSFTHVSVKVVDLADRSAQPLTYSIGR